MRSRTTTELVLFASLFLISGAAGLIYEVVWERLLELYFGVTSVAITLIVSAYMAGLGLGSIVGGHLSRRLRSPLSLYGWIEILIGLFGLVSIHLINWIGEATAGSPYILVFLISFSLLLIPTFLMGTTLPLLSQAFVRDAADTGRVIGLLYGINTLGAAIGAAVAGYILIGTSGLQGAILYAFSGNMAIGILALAVKRLPKHAVDTTPATEKRMVQTNLHWGYPNILTASFLTGFLGLGYEMLWIRTLHITSKSTAYNFPTVLSIFLFGLAIGGAIWGARSDRVKDPISLFVKLELAGGITAGALFLVFFHGMQHPAIQEWLVNNFLFFQQPRSPYVAPLGEFVFSKWELFRSLANYLPLFLFLILPPALLMGGGLPILDRIAIENPQIVGRRVGDIHLANIIGSVAGSLVISFLTIPKLGTEWTLRMLIAMSLIFFFLSIPGRKWRKDHHQSIWIEAMLVLACIIMIPGKGQFFIRLYETATRTQAVITEAAETILAVTYQDDERSNLWIGGETNSYFPTQGTWESQALLCSGASQPHKVLIIGYGGGHTAMFFTAQPEITEIIIVELVSDLIPFMEEQSPITRAVRADPRVRVIADDGRRFLYANPGGNFDLIIIDPVRSYTNGHNNLYSIEALDLYSKQLSPSGVFCAWHDEVHVIPKTIASVFPYLDQFGDLSVAANQPLTYDLRFMEQSTEYFLAQNIEQSPTLEETLDGKTLLGNFTRDRNQLLEEEANSPILTDMRPLLEYYFNTKPIEDYLSKDYFIRSLFTERIAGCDDQCREYIRSR